MRTLAVKLGELNPHDDADRWFIWMDAVEWFLCPTSKHENANARLLNHPMFWTWCSEVGDVLGFVDGLINHLYPDQTSLNVIYAKESDRHSETGNDGGLAVATELDRLWDTSWIAISKPRPSGTGRIPVGRNAARGLKFCLVTLVLRLGIFDGSEPMNGEHKFVKWGDAIEASSLLLALSIYWTIGNGQDADFNPPVPTWSAVKSAASVKIRSAAGDLMDLKGHAEHEGIEGFRKRLRASLNDSAFRSVAGLAAEFERQGSSGLVKWRNESLLSNWFVVGRD